MAMSRVWVDRGTRFLYLTGRTPYEVGLAHGRLLDGQIREFCREAQDLFSLRFGNVGGPALLRAFSAAGRVIAGNFPPALWQEMNGIAKGAGVPLDFVIFTNTVYEIGALLNDKLRFHACSCFVSARAGVMGKTNDLALPDSLVSLLTRNRIVVTYDVPWAKAKYATFSFPMSLATDSLLLESGVAMGVNDGGPSQKSMDFRNLSVPAIIRKVAERSSTSADALRNLRAEKTIKPFIFTVTDGTPEGSFVMEKDKGASLVRRPDGGAALVATNHFLSERMRKAHYLPGYRKSEFWADSEKRYSWMKRTLPKVRALEDGTKPLRLHTRGHKYLSGSVSNRKTVNAFVVSPGEKKVLIAVGDRAPATLFGRWEPYDFWEIFGT